MSALRRAVHAAILRTEALPEGGWRRWFRFARHSTVFAGHFPARPVLPAAVQLLMAQDLLEGGNGGPPVEGAPFSLARVLQAKFLAPLGAEQEIVLRALPGHCAEARGRVWNIEVRCGATLAARMQLEGA